MQIPTSALELSGALFVPGTFDGPTAGHASLFERALRSGQRLHRPVVAQVFTGTEPQLCTKQEKHDALRRMGVEHILFEEQPLQLEQYTLGADSFLVCGEDRAKAFAHIDAERVDAVALRLLGDAIIRPALAHEALVAKDFAQLNALLFEPYVMQGEVIHGQHIGSSKLGVPTANIATPSKQLPPHGVYYALARTQDGQVWRSIVNIGMRPSVTDSPEVTVETHIIGLQRDLYGQRLQVYPMEHIRGVIRFPSLEALSEQLQRDILYAKTCEFDDSLLP